MSAWRTFLNMHGHWSLSINKLEFLVRTVLKIVVFITAESANCTHVVQWLVGSSDLEWSV